MSSMGSYLVMRQHVEPLPVTLDLGGHVLVLQDDPDTSALTPLCENNKTKQTIYEDGKKQQLDSLYS